MGSGPRGDIPGLRRHVKTAPGTRPQTAALRLPCVTQSLQPTPPSGSGPRGGPAPALTASPRRAPNWMRQGGERTYPERKGTGPEERSPASPGSAPTQLRLRTARLFVRPDARPSLPFMAWEGAIYSMGGLAPNSRPASSVISPIRGGKSLRVGKNESRKMPSARPEPPRARGVGRPPHQAWLSSHPCARCHTSSQTSLQACDAAGPQAPTRVRPGSPRTAPVSCAFYHHVRPVPGDGRGPRGLGVCAGGAFVLS